MSFGEEDLKQPVVVSHTSSKCHPTRLDIRGDEKLIRIEFTKGEGTGANYNPRFSDNVTIQNLPPDENDQPQPQEWDILVAGTEIADWCKAQPSSPTNGVVLQKLASCILTKKNVI